MGDPAQPPSVSRCAPRSRSPVSLIVLTRSCSRAGGDPVLLPPLVWCVRFIYLFIYTLRKIIYNKAPSHDTGHGTGAHCHWHTLSHTNTGTSCGKKNVFCNLRHAESLEVDSVGNPKGRFSSTAARRRGQEHVHSTPPHTLEASDRGQRRRRGCVVFDRVAVCEYVGSRRWSATALGRPGGVARGESALVPQKQRRNVSALDNTCRHSAV